MSVNGREYSHVNKKIRIDNVLYDEVSDLSYGYEIEGVEYVYGTSDVPLSATDGRFKPGEVSLTITRSQFVELQRNLGAAFMQRRFQVHVTSRIDGAPDVKHVLNSCRIIKNDSGTSSGGGPDLVKLTLHMMSLFDGAYPMRKIGFGAANVT